MFETEEAIVVKGVGAGGVFATDSTTATVITERGRGGGAAVLLVVVDCFVSPAVEAVVAEGAAVVVGL